LFLEGDPFPVSDITVGVDPDSKGLSVNHVNAAVKFPRKSQAPIVVKDPNTPLSGVEDCFGMTAKGLMQLFPQFRVHRDPLLSI
jgi:hypothetical protein